MPEASLAVLGDSGTTRYRHDERVLERRSLDAVLLLPPGTSDPLELSGAATLLWERFCEAATFDEATEGLSLVFGLPAARCRSDLQPTFNRLIDAGALTPVHAASNSGGGRT